MPVTVEMSSIGWMIGLFVGILISLEIGRRLGLRHLRKNESEGKGPPVEAALFGLLGLLIAFTFSGASTRFDNRRTLLVEEANRLDTAYMRTELLPEETRPAIKDKLREYLDSRLATYRKVPDMEAVYEELRNNARIQNELWILAVGAVEKAKSPPLASQFTQSLNLVFEMKNTQLTVVEMHPPKVIFIMLAILVFAVSLLAGFATAQVKSRSWLHICVFAFIFGLTIYVILDLEYPRLGLIRVDSFDKVLYDARERMN